MMNIQFTQVTSRVFVINFTNVSFNLPKPTAQQRNVTDCNEIKYFIDAITSNTLNVPKTRVVCRTGATQLLYLSINKSISVPVLLPFSFQMP